MKESLYPLCIFIGISIFALSAAQLTNRFLLAHTVKELRAMAPAGSKILEKINFGLLDLTAIEKHISQGYGKTAFAASSGGFKEPWHNGIDIAAPAGTPLHSASDGKILVVGNQDIYCPGKGYGKFIVVENSDGHTLLYAHLSAFKVKAGASVRKGDVLGLVGATGFATGPHVHFSVFTKDSFGMDQKPNCGLTPEGEDINPLGYLRILQSGQ